jgi:4-amino-4-deoxy-L-arabinose transferase-like glycosyltransferase
MTLPTPTLAPAADQPQAATGWLWPGPRGQAVLLIVWLAGRYLFDARRQLVPDEAYYWVWSRHPALSYFDHPPMVAWMIRLGTALAGTNELGVRWPAIVFMVATILLLAWAARRLIGHQAAVFVPVALLFSPVVNTLGGIVTPDTPACFFQAGALVCVLIIFSPRTPGPKSLWLVFGLCIGLALLSKYTSVILGLAVLVALVWTRQGRSHLRTVWPWLAAIVAVAVFLPAVIWNANHDWASFRFQLHHGMADSRSRPIPQLLEYVGGQIGIWTPVLFGVCVVAIFRAWRGGDRSTYNRILLLAATLPLVFFAVSSIRGRVEVNWPIFAFFPAVFLVAQDLAAHFSVQRVLWAEIAVKIALLATIFVQVPEAVWAINSSWGIKKWNDLFGWRELAAEVDQVRGQRQVFGADYEWAAELSFYMPGQPEIWPLSSLVRPSAFDYFPDSRKLDSFQRVLVVSGIGKTATRPSGSVALRNFQIVTDMDFSTFKHGRELRRSLLLFADRKINPDTRPDSEP